MHMSSSRCFGFSLLRSGEVSFCSAAASEFRIGGVASKKVAQLGNAILCTHGTDTITLTSSSLSGLCWKQVSKV